MTPSGCAVEDIITNLDYNRITDGFLKFKQLGDSPALAPAQKRLLRDIGILNEPDILFALETGYQEAVAKIKSSSTSKDKWRRQTKTLRSR